MSSTEDKETARYVFTDASIKLTIKEVSSYLWCINSSDDLLPDFIL